MSAWTIATNNDLAVKRWMEKLFRWFRSELSLSPFISSSPNSIIWEKTELEKAKGDEITFGITAPLIGAGFGEGENVEGNEADLSVYSDSVTLERRRNAIKVENKMSKQRVLFSMTEEAALALKEWAAQLIEKKLITALTTSNTKTFYGGSATSVDTLTANDKITPSLLSKARVWALSEGSSEGSKPVMKPVMIKGRPFLVFIAHRNAHYDLKRNSEYLQNLRECREASENHPIFTGASGVTHDGIILHESDKLPFYTTGGAGEDVPYAQNLLLGQQAAVLAWGERPNIVSDEKDYKEYLGQCIGVTYGVKKVQFNSNDFGVVSVTTACTNIS
jgi:N4-gp56 family major capsid protein